MEGTGFTSGVRTGETRADLFIKMGDTEEGLVGMWASQEAKQWPLI